MSLDTKQILDSHRYTIDCPDAVNFITGITNTQEQVIIGVPGPLLLAVFFDQEGRLLRHEIRGSSNYSIENQKNPPHKVRGNERTLLWHNLEAWKSEISYTPSAVRVFSFYLPDLDIGIRELSRYLQDFLDGNSEERDGSEVVEYEIEIEEWRSLGKFVLSWGNEYWLNSSGVVTDT